MARCCLKTPNTIEDIETFIDEHRQHHPELSDDQGEASHRELEELSTLEEENITEEQNEDDVVIGDQLADALDLIQNIVSANCQEDLECQNKIRNDQIASWNWK